MTHPYCARDLVTASPRPKLAYVSAERREKDAYAAREAVARAAVAAREAAAQVEKESREAALEAKRAAIYDSPDNTASLLARWSARDGAKCSERDTCRESAWLWTWDYRERDGSACFPYCLQEVPLFDKLESMQPSAGRPLFRDVPTALTLAREYAALEAGITCDQSRAEFEPTARRWFIVKDTTYVVPASVVTDAERLAFAKRYRAGVDSLRDREMRVYAVAGDFVQLVLWHESPLSNAQVRDVCSRLAPGDRFEPVEYPWKAPAQIEVLKPDHEESDEPDEYEPHVYLKPVHKPATGFVRAADSAGSAQPTQGLNTGIAALDSQFRGIACLPHGARVCISGPPKNCKTNLMLEFAENACAQGWFVVWDAQDERPELITVRRLQRLGLTPAQAMKQPADAPKSQALAKLEAQDFYTIERMLLEDACKLAHEEAHGKPILMALDSLQKVRTRAGEGKGERERIDATLAAIEECQRLYPSVTCIYTSEVTRGSGEAKGSIGIEYSSTLHLVVRKQGNTIAVAIKANRHGSTEAFTLTADLDAQRLRDPSAEKADASLASAWAEVRKALVEHGPLSRKGLEVWVTCGTMILRKCLAVRVGVGDLVHADQKYSLA